MFDEGLRIYVYLCYSCILSRLNLEERGGVHYPHPLFFPTININFNQWYNKIIQKKYIKILKNKFNNYLIIDKLLSDKL